MTNVFGVWELIMRQQLQPRAEASPLDTHQRDVDSVRRGAAHDAGDDHEETSICASVFARTSSLNSQMWRRNRSTVFCVGTGDMRIFSAREFFFAARIRRDLSAMSRANFLSLSACL